MAYSLQYTRDGGWGLDMDARPTSGDLVGAYVARTILDGSGRRVLLRAGTLLTPRVLRLLARHGIERLEVSDTPPIVAGGSIDQAIRDRAAAATADFAQAALGAGDAGESAARVERSAVEIVQHVQQLRRVRYNLRHLRAWDEYTFHHSIQVAELAVVIGQGMGLSDDELTRLAIGASLHDIGKAAIPLQVLHKPGRLNDEEYDIIKTHPRLGWRMVRRAADLWHTSTIVLLQHHERLDGTGYPDGLRSDEIYLFSRIVAVADCYDAMRADRGYRGPMPAAEVLAILAREADTSLDARAIQALLARVNLYPDGEVVRLSNGRVALVTEQNPGDLLHPLVELLPEIGESEGHVMLDLASSGLDVLEIVAERNAPTAESLLRGPPQ